MGGPSGKGDGDDCDGDHNGDNDDNQVLIKKMTKIKKKQVTKVFLIVITRLIRVGS